MRSKIHTTVKLFLFLSIIGFIEGCGKRLGHGAILCSLGSVRIGEFKESLCTHTLVGAWFDCKDDVCNPRISADSEAMIERLQPYMPTGIYISVNLEAEEFLKRRQRRRNTIEAITHFMSSKNLTIVQFVEFHWHPTIKRKERRNYIDLVEDMAEMAHKHGWAVGIQVELFGKAVNSVYDFEELVEYLDYFILSVRRDEVMVNGKYVLGAAFPLTSKSNEGGSFKYALDYISPHIKPECLLMQLEGGGKRYFATDSWVDAGPGSLAEPSDIFIPYAEICRRNVDERCPEFWDDSASLPYSVCNTKEYFSYENQTSIRLKIDLMNSRHVAGVQYHWTTHDDVDGQCGLGRMPQLVAMQGIRQGPQKRNAFTHFS